MHGPPHCLRRIGSPACWRVLSKHLSQWLGYMFVVETGAPARMQRRSPAPRLPMNCFSRMAIVNLKMDLTVGIRRLETQSRGP